MAGDQMIKPKPVDPDTLPDSLPRTAYARLPMTGETIMVKKGEVGYWKTSYGDIPPYIMNDKMGVTDAQASAMLNGSIFGWNLPAANPREKINIMLGASVTGRPLGDKVV